MEPTHPIRAWGKSLKRKKMEKENRFRRKSTFKLKKGKKMHCMYSVSNFLSRYTWKKSYEWNGFCCMYCFLRVPYSLIWSQIWYYINNSYKKGLIYSLSTQRPTFVLHRQQIDSGCSLPLSQTDNRQTAGLQQIGCSLQTLTLQRSTAGTKKTNKKTRWMRYFKALKTSALRILGILNSW